MWQSMLVDEILDLPPDQRLDAAIAMLRTLTCDHPSALGYYQDRFGLSQRHAAVLNYLVQRAGRTVSKDQIFHAAWPMECDFHADGCVRKAMRRIRCAIKDFATVVLLNETGYLLTKSDAEKIAFPMEAMPVDGMPYPRSGTGLGPVSLGRRWTDKDDANLVQMHQNGSSTWAIAEDLGRTQGAVVTRKIHLGCSSTQRKWTAADHADLKRMLDEGRSGPEMAKTLKRTTNAVRKQLCKLRLKRKKVKP